jgi:hypothetical protein
MKGEEECNIITRVQDISNGFFSEVADLGSRINDVVVWSEDSGNVLCHILQAVEMSGSLRWCYVLHRKNIFF